MITLLYRDAPFDVNVVSFETFVAAVIVFGGIYLVFRWLEKDDSTKFD